MSYLRRITCWLLVLCLSLLILGCGLTELLQTTPDTATITPTETATATPSSTVPAHSETPTPDEPPPLPVPPAEADAPEVPTALPETSTPAPPPPLTDTSSPTLTGTPPGLRIDAFDVRIEDAPGGGKTIRCSWETSGASSVRIVVSTRQRFPVWQDGNPDGTATFEVTETLYNTPDVTLTALGINGGEAVESVTLDWLCTHTYFFAASVANPQICPAAAAVTVQGAQQPFQGGAMFWIPSIEGNDWIYILYNNGTWQCYEDAWHEGLPESDPSIVPPSGYLQPIRGFGKVWREHPEVQSGLNWATLGESAIAITYQRQVQEAIGGVQYIRSAGAHVVRLDGIGGSGSTWTSLP